MSKPSESICYLCGGAIERNPKNELMELSMDHVPPLQFYPKQIRGEIEGRLLKLPTHKRCNMSFKNDEEYFVHTYSYHVDQNSDKACQLIEEIKRRSRKKQSQRLLHMIQKEFADVTIGGIHLPDGIIVHNVNAARVDRIIRKIVQGLYYLEENKYLPHETAMWVQLYEKPNDMPDVFSKVFCETGSCKGVYPKAFSYRHLNIQNYSYWSMLFWDSLLFCLIFKT